MLFTWMEKKGVVVNTQDGGWKRWRILVLVLVGVLIVLMIFAEVIFFLVMKRLVLRK